MLFFTLSPSSVERFRRRVRHLMLSTRLSDSRVEPLTGPDRSIRTTARRLVVGGSNFSGGSVTSTKAQRIMVGSVLMLLADALAPTKLRTPRFPANQSLLLLFRAPRCLHRLANRSFPAARIAERQTSRVGLECDHPASPRGAPGDGGGA
jgi:hypothetical protein